MPSYPEDAGEARRGVRRQGSSGFGYLLPDTDTAAAARGGVSYSVWGVAGVIEVA
jgi:hypothetical protein